MPEEEQSPKALGHLLSVLGERSASITEKIGLLREAQNALRDEMRRLAGVTPLDREALQHLGRSAHVLAEQAEVLILNMVEHGALHKLVVLVEEIFDSLRDAEAQIGTVLKRRQR
jgi:hypothetical protein